jgi:glycosyltransferase involved in cell wall biosynthesis
MRDILTHRCNSISDVSVLASGVPTDIFYPEPDPEMTAGNRFYLLYVGKISRRKGVQVLLDAMAHLPDDGPEYYLRLIGGDSLPETVSMPDGISEQVELVGRVPRADLAAEYRAADAYVIPSYWELESTSMMEALACGTPTVACDNSSFCEVGTEESCSYFKPGDAAGMATAIVNVYENYQAYRRGALVHADEYNIANTYRDVIEAYEKIAG